MSAVLGLVVGATVLAGFWAHRPAPARVLALAAVAPVTSGWALPPPARRLVPAGVVGVLACLVLGPLGPIAGLVAWAVPVWRARRRRAIDASAVARELPGVVDLFAVAVGAGLTVPLAVVAVGERVDGAVGRALRRAAAAIAAGQRCADALDGAAAELGPAARPLLDALRASERYGAPLADALVRISADVRAERRRAAEEAARRVPVKLLFPLVVCVLPAFALLTVAPLLAGTLRSLRL